MLWYDGIFQRINSADFNELLLSNVGAGERTELKGFQLCPCRIRSFIYLSRWRVSAVTVSDSALHLLDI